MEFGKKRSDAWIICVSGYHAFKGYFTEKQLIILGECLVELLVRDEGDGCLIGGSEATSARSGVEVLDFFDRRCDDLDEHDLGDGVVTFPELEFGGTLIAHDNLEWASVVSIDNSSFYR